MKIECPKHGEVEFNGTGDFIGDESPITMYCPECVGEEQTTQLYHEMTDDRITIYCGSEKCKIEISTTEEYAKTCGFLYITLRHADEREPLIAQWIYRHIEEAKLALLVVGLKLEGPDKHILYSDLKQLVGQKQFHDAIDEAMLFEEIASGRIPFYASVEERDKRPTVLDAVSEIIREHGDPRLLHRLSLA